MKILNKKEPLLLLVGDIVIFALALWLTLFLRYGELPAHKVLVQHFVPFAYIFALWAVVFFIAGLYDNHTVILRSRLPNILFRTQVANSMLAVFFFYLIPYFRITPKVNILLDLAISFGLLVLWRVHGFGLFGARRKQNAILIGSGAEMTELRNEVNNNPRYNIRFISSVDTDKLAGIDFQQEILERIYREEVSLVAVDLQNERIEPILPHLYNLIFSKIRFIGMHKVYEDIFKRVPLSIIKYSWFLENISLSPKVTYDALKRLMDVTLSLALGAVSLVVYPFVFLAVKLDDGGKIFITQERVGENNHIVRLLKFRTMERNDKGEWEKGVPNKVTRVGAFLRRTRIDELPQLWNVVRGDLSLIGPRPEFPEPVKKYEAQVPYYNVRHLIKPGLSGWAQIYHEKHPHHTVDIVETKNKLSYDLYYLKNRSFFLDLKIALRTLKTLLSRSGV